jgi:hypothetical protein
MKCPQVLEDSEDQMVADFLTKPLQGKAFVEF